MKAFLSFCAILILLQTLLFSSLVKLELPGAYQDQWGETFIHKPFVLDPFLVPGKDGVNQNFQNKNEWVPVHFNNSLMIRNNSALPIVSEFLYKSAVRRNNNTIPVFIMNGTLRI